MVYSQISRFTGNTEIDTISKQFGSSQVQLLRLVFYLAVDSSVEGESENTELTGSQGHVGAC